MLPSQIERLIRAEHQSSGASVDVEEYIKKLRTKAEILAFFEREECKGFVAYYCNDMESKSAFITTVVIHPSARRTGIGKMLVRCVLTTMQERGFILCYLEVQKTNIPAYRLYRSLGFTPSVEKDRSYILSLKMGT